MHLPWRSSMVYFLAFCHLPLLSTLRGRLWQKKVAWFRGSSGWGKSLSRWPRIEGCIDTFFPLQKASVPMKWLVRFAELEKSRCQPVVLKGVWPKQAGAIYFSGAVSALGRHPDFCPCQFNLNGFPPSIRLLLMGSQLPTSCPLLAMNYVLNATFQPLTSG